LRSVSRRIPFNKPYIGEEEVRAAAEVIRSGKIRGNEGPIGFAVENQLKNLYGVKHVLLTTSCTHAMELAMMVLGIKQGDEVICPSFTFTSTATCIVLQGAKPVFTEIEEETANIDPEDIKRKITEKTKAIMCMHYAGVGCKMDEINKMAGEHGIYVVEDAAQAIGAKYKGKYLGTVSDVGCLSFHETKNITCGEGGAFFTNNDDFFDKASIISEKGTDRRDFLKRKKKGKYTWVDRGSSFVLSDVLAAILGEQLKKIEIITRKRQLIFKHYFDGLKDLEDEGKIVLPYVPDYCKPNGHIFYIRLRTEQERDLLIEKMYKRGIDSVFHYIPLHSSPYAKRQYGYKEEDLPITEKVSATLIRLPIYPDLSFEDQEYVINSIKNALS